VFSAVESSTLEILHVGHNMALKQIAKTFESVRILLGFCPLGGAVYSPSSPVDGALSQKDIL
jgi:hypothetical protein